MCSQCGVRDAKAKGLCMRCYQRTYTRDYQRQWREANQHHYRSPQLARRCAECGAAFTTAQPRKVYCSALCKNRVDNRRRYQAGTRRRFPVVRGQARQAIFDRDGWRCGLCHAVIDPSLAWPHPGSPSIDHIDPHGAHEPANWQASHLACNVQAGAKAAA